VKKCLSVALVALSLVGYSSVQAKGSLGTWIDYNNTGAYGGASENMQNLDRDIATLFVLHGAVQQNMVSGQTDYIEPELQVVAKTPAEAQNVIAKAVTSHPSFAKAFNLKVEADGKDSRYVFTDPKTQKVQTVIVRCQASGEVQMCKAVSRP
jgi:hypothetical protein